MRGSGPLARLTSAVAPPRCGACGAVCEPGAALCEKCEDEIGGARPSIAPGPGGVDVAVAAAPHEGAARLLAHGLKYGRRIALAAVAARTLIEACPAEALRGVVVPVPAAPLRGRWRGFDPAEEIAIALAALAGLGYSRCLRRGMGPRQVGRSRRERLADPPRVALRRAAIAPRRALIVDDVHTTGATLSASARALRAGGTEAIVALVFARSGYGRGPLGEP